MTIKKTDLYDYVNDKIRVQKSTVLKDLGKIEEAVKDAIRMNLKDVQFISQKASTLEEVIGKAIQRNLHYTQNAWNIQQKHKHAVELMSFVTALVNGIYANVAKDYLRHQSNVATMDKWYPEVKRFIDSTVEDYSKLNTRMENIDTLSRELTAVIKSSSTGANAYKHLEDLGLDMTDFKSSTNTSLPVVQKLSVDVCLVNGGC